jgi:L,D-peptidoglycan transpeptidase YkuD (ErfK/YbiS/YcfS/YnhG family)
MFEPTKGIGSQKSLQPATRVLFAIGVLLLPVGCLSAQEVSYQLATPTNELAQCEQMVLVVVPSWKSTSGSIRLLQRSSAGKWIIVRPRFSCVVGRNGLGWGIGLHGTGVFGEPRKKEGDGRGPAGIFRLSRCLGIAPLNEAGVVRFPYHQITATTEAVFDPRSRYYNRVVDRDSVDRVDWTGAERMLRPDGLYRWVVVVEHNWKPYPSFGSCIFLHLWQSKGIPTIGCTAMSLEDLTFLVHWLDANEHPLLVQLPEEAYLSLKPKWKLP